LHPFPLPAHLSIDAEYIDINIHELYATGGNLVITTSAPVAVARKARRTGLWILSGRVAPVFIGAGRESGRVDQQRSKP
jgi:hypothetical protein